MTSPPEGFNQSTALQLRHAAADEKKWTRILDAIDEVTRVLDADGFQQEQDQQSGSAWEQLLTPSTFSRRVTLRSNQLVNVQRTVRLNALYHSEQQLLTEANRLTLSELFKDEEESLTGSCTTEEKEEGTPWIEPLTDGEQLLLLRAVESHIRLNVDDVSQLSGNAASIGPGTWNHLVPLFGQALLSDFFKVCEHPNEAELHMFTAIFNFPDVEHTEHCFEERREDVKSVTRARTLLQGRKARIEQKSARRLEKATQKVVLD